MTGVAASVHNEAGSSQSGTGGAQQPLPPTSITLEELGDINRRWMEDAKAKRQLPRSSMSLQELKVKNRLLIKENPNKLFRESYYMWKETDDFFVVRAEKKNQKIGSLYNEIYQLIGFFSVFQGVILIACAQSNLLTCHNWWTTFFLSLLASLVTIFGVIQKFRTILTLKETIQTEDDSRKDCIRFSKRLLEKREAFCFKRDASEEPEKPPQSRKWPAIGVIVLLFLFGGFILLSIYKILCDPGKLTPKK